MFSIQVTNEIHLELISYDHSDALFSLIEIEREYLAQWLVWPKYISSKTDYDGFVKRSLTEYANEESLVLCIFYKGKPVGTAAFVNLQKDLEKGEIGYWIASSVQGNGIATQVSKKLIEIGFKKLGLSKIEVSVAVDNERSQAVCERLGMEIEGVISNVEKIGEKIFSHKKYALFNTNL